MAVSNIFTYIGIIFIVLILSMGFLIAGDSFKNNDKVTLTQESITYISEYEGYLQTAGIDTAADVDTGELKNTDVTRETNETGTVPTDNFMVTFNFIRNKIAAVEAYTKLTYSMPIFLISAASLDIGDFSIYTGILIGVIFIILVIVYMRLIK